MTAPIPPEGAEGDNETRLADEYLEKYASDAYRCCGTCGQVASDKYNQVLLRRGYLAGYARGQEKSASEIAELKEYKRLHDLDAVRVDMTARNALRAELSSITKQLEEAHAANAAIRARLEGARHHIAKVIKMHHSAPTAGIRLQRALASLTEKKEKK